MVTNDLASQLFIRAGLLKILAFLEQYQLLSVKEHTDDDYRVEIIKNSLCLHSSALW